MGGIIRRRLLRQPIQMFIAAVRTDDLRTLAELIDAGKVRPIIDRIYPLEHTAEALRYVETGKAAGKVVIRIRGHADPGMTLYLTGEQARRRSEIVANGR